MGAHAANASDYEEYSYDAAGNMTSKRLRSGETISYTYDVLNRETVKDIPGGTAADVYSGYDLLGRKLFAKFVSTSGDGVVYTYDALARILSETSYGRALTFQYDLASNRTRITYPDANYIQTTYDVLNRAQEVRENGATSGAGLLGVYAYDNLQRRTSVTFGNGTAETFAYDTDSRDWSLTQNLASTSQDVTLAFTLSPAPQILTRDLSNSAYGYTPPTLSKSYTANGLNQYTEVGGAAFTNDARGNLTSDGSRTFAYDLENHLTSVSGSASMTLTYDPLGRLRETVSGGATTQFLYDGDRLVAEYDGSNNLLRRYAHGPGVDEPLVWYEGSSLTDRRTHHADNQGSIVATSDGSGVGVIQTYGPYGEPASWSGSRFKYTGQVAISEVSLYHYKARVYDPVLGRFLQTDPVGYEDQMNLYAYVRNDPMNKLDPKGTDVWAVGEEYDLFVIYGGSYERGWYYDEKTGEFGDYTKKGTGQGLQGSAGPSVTRQKGGVGDFSGKSSSVEIDSPFGPGYSESITTPGKDADVGTPLYDVGKRDLTGEKPSPSSQDGKSGSYGFGPGGASQQTTETTTRKWGNAPSRKEIEGTLKGAYADAKSWACTNLGLACGN